MILIRIRINGTAAYPQCVHQFCKADESASRKVEFKLFSIYFIVKINGINNRIDREFIRLKGNCTCAAFRLLCRYFSVNDYSPHLIIHMDNYRRFCSLRRSRDRLHGHPDRVQRLDLCACFIKEGDIYCLYLYN